MTTYLVVNMLLLLFGILNSSKLILVSCSFTLLFLISGLRGEFTSDYRNYIELFKYYNLFSFNEIFQQNFGQEIGYVLLNRLIGAFTDNGMYLGIVTSIIVLSLFFKEIRTYSTNVWFSIFMFVTIGDFYTSFNLTRQIIAAGIIFSASKYLYERKIFKYFVYIFLAALFHKTALIMIIFYFILTLKIEKRILFLLTIIFTITFIHINDLLMVIQKFFYSYYTEGSYGMTGYNYKNVILPIFILIFVIIHISKLDQNDIKIRVWINAIIYYAFFSILGLKVQMIQRLAFFFSPYVLLIVPKIITSVRNKNERLFYLILAIFFFFLYNFLALQGTGYDPYYFIWQSM